MHSDMLCKTEVAALFSKIAAFAAYPAIIKFDAIRQGTTRFANSQISQNVSIEDKRVTLTLYNGQRQATSTTNDITDTGLQELVASVDALLKVVPESDEPVLTLESSIVYDKGEEANLANTFDIAGRATILAQGLREIEPGFTASGALVLTETVTAIGDGGAGLSYANYCNVTFNTVVSHTSGADGAAAVTSYTTAPDIAAAFATAMATSKMAISPVEAPLGGVTVVLSPTAFGDLVSFATNMLNAKEIENGSSFAIDNIGRQLFSSCLTITDDYTNAQLLPLPFDADGVPRSRLPLIEGGVIKAVAYDKKHAAKHGVQSTGHAIAARWYSGAIPLHVVVECGQQTVEEIIASTEKGVFINEFHYTNFVNARNLQVTGLTRNGAFLIENGKITKPISTVRFTESLLDAFSNITAISNTRELVPDIGAMLVPAVRIENFHFTSRA